MRAPDVWPGTSARYGAYIFLKFRIFFGIHGMTFES